MPKLQSAIALLDPKYDGNVGGAIRAAGNQGSQLIIISGPQRWKHEATNRGKFHRTIPTLLVPNLDDIRLVGYETVVVERLPDATPLPDFDHPTKALYVFGPENGSVPDSVPRDHNVEIPSYYSMNLAMCVSVVLYDRACKNGLDRVSNGWQG